MTNVTLSLSLVVYEHDTYTLLPGDLYSVWQLSFNDLFYLIALWTVPVTCNPPCQLESTL